MHGRYQQWFDARFLARLRRGGHDQRTAHHGGSCKRVGRHWPAPAYGDIWAADQAFAAPSLFVIFSLVNLSSEVRVIGARNYVSSQKLAENLAGDATCW